MMLVTQFQGLWPIPMRELRLVWMFCLHTGVGTLLCCLIAIFAICLHWSAELAKQNGGAIYVQYGFMFFEYLFYTIDATVLTWLYIHQTRKLITDIRHLDS